MTEALRRGDHLTIIPAGVLKLKMAKPPSFSIPQSIKNICKRDAFEKDYFDCDIDADARAVAAAEKMFSKPVEPVMIPNIAADGGGLHCISWDMSY